MAFVTGTLIAAAGQIAQVTVLFVKRYQDQAYRAATGPVIAGLGRGRDHVAAMLGGGPGDSERHFTWGPEVVRFPSRVGNRRYLQLSFETAPTPHPPH